MKLNYVVKEPERSSLCHSLSRNLLVPMAVVGIVLFATPFSGQQTSLRNPEKPITPERAVLNRYCVGCHNEKTKTAGLTLEKIDVQNVGDAAPTWEKVVRKLRTTAMPPTGMPRPDKGTYDSLASYLERKLDEAAAANPNPGTPLINRLNRTEYANATRDLLGVDEDAIDVQLLLPPDDASYGFDNIGDVLTVSPLLMEGYMSASSKISRLAVGDLSPAPAEITYDMPTYIMQNDRMSEDLPFGSRGGKAIRHYFPADGEYEIKIRLQTNRSDIDHSIVLGLTEPHQLDIRVDGERIKLFTVGDKDVTGATLTRAQRLDLGPALQLAARNGYNPKLTQEERYALASGLEVRIPVKSGTHRIAVNFVNRPVASEGLFQPPVTDYANGNEGGNPDMDPAIATVIIGGPYNPKGVGETASRQRIFICHPAGPKDEDPCAKKIISLLARRAFRRPVSDDDVNEILSIYTESRRKSGFEKGIQAALQRILVDPDFLFRIERDPKNASPGMSHRISDVELASRLSFFLWSSIPDDELISLAERNKLSDPSVLEKQVRRMLADSRSKALVENFAGQWLYLRNINSIIPNPEVFPEFISNLRDDFKQETQLFFESTLRENRSVLDLLNADYTFLNERLAEHYRIPNVSGSHFRRVTLTDQNRRGLLGQGSTLMVTSYATRTSPTLRGKWVLDSLLGTPPPPPPPNVPSLKENGENGTVLTMRERMEGHRANPACATCHRVMDPLGFALENFDATGKWRDKEGDKPIDASGLLPDGTKFQGPAELRQILLSKPDQFATTVTEKLMTYALGRGVEYYDQPALRKIMRDAGPEYRWSSLILGLVKSAPFQMRRVEAP